MVSGGDESAQPKSVIEEDKVEEPARNFTAEQLRYFDGKKEKLEDKAFKPVYLSLDGTVFDVSAGRDFYGPEGPYEKFAGRECGVALAKMSFDEEHLDDLDGCKALNFGEKTQLDEWKEKFQYYRNYPIKGRYVPDKALPKEDRILSPKELAKYNGDPSVEVPAGYATAPIYVGAGDKVFDMSFGGVTRYGPDGPYHKFAGKDASRALAVMSVDIKDIDNNELKDLTEKELSILRDWIKTFEEKKGYPVVGKLDKKQVW